MIPHRYGSGGTVQGDFLVVIAAQGHAVLERYFVVHRPICGIRCSYNICILVISADGYGLGGDFLHIADVGGIGFYSINRATGVIIPGLAAGYIGNLLTATADAAGGDTGAAIINGQACTVQGGRTGGQGAVGTIDGDGFIACSHSYLIRRELGVHLHGDDAVIINFRGQVVRLVGMAGLGIIGTDGHSAAQSAVHRLVSAIYLVAGREIQALGDGFRIGGNLGLVAVHHIGHALQLILRSSPAGNIRCLAYSPGSIVQASEIVAALGGIIAVGLGAQLGAASRHRIQTGDVFGQFQGQGGAIGGNADIITRCQVSCTALYVESLVQFNAARSRISSQFQAIPESSHRMSRAVPIGIADAARALGTGKFRRCGIACSDGGGFVGTATVRSYDLDGASLASVSGSPFRTGSDGIKHRILVQSNGKALIGRIRQDFHILGGVFRIFLPAAALDLESPPLVYMDRSVSIIALEVHTLGFHSLQLGHVHRIGIRRPGSQIGDLAADGLTFCICPTQGNTPGSGHPGGCLSCIGRIRHIRSQIAGRSFFPIGHRVGA
ncbi:unknown [Acidaminococcus sp. CAG:542]|nr:unknown [Acidaminococcus sp. CAG:542]